MILRTTLIVLLALAASGAAAQTIYKSVMPDGRIIYGNAPAKGAANIEQIQLTLPPPVEGATSATPQAPPDANQSDRAPASRDAKWSTAEEEIRDAQAALSQAQANAKAGVAPIPGEMIGNANNSFVRPSEAYFARQQQLADKVKEAQARVDQALAARNALR